jgi:preprotein translocase subunit SecG
VTADAVLTGLTGVADGVAAAARDRPWVLAAGLLALLLVAWTPAWRPARGVVTIAHEGGHALVAVLAGRGLDGIRLHADSSGVTTSRGRGGGVGLVLTFLAGYPAPALLGLGGAALVAADRAVPALWIVVALLAATLLQVRNAYGAVSVVGTGAVVGAVAWWGSAGVQAGFAAALAWFLLFGGLRSVHELARARRRVPARSGSGYRSGFPAETDADALARLTGVPAGMWVALLMVAASASVLAGAWVLLKGSG